MAEDTKFFRDSERAAKAAAGDKSRRSADAKKSAGAAQKGERDAKKSISAGKRGARLAKAGGAGRSRKSLRAAAARSGRGIAIKNNKNGKDFAGLASYASQEKKGARLVFSNCGDVKTAIKTMERCAKLRPDIENPVGHITLSLPPSSGHEMTDARWQEIVKEHLSLIDLDDSFPIIATRHMDTQHDHSHIEFCRVSIDGKVHDQRNLGLRCAAAEAVIEQKFNLPLTPRSEFKTARNISKAELELGLRTGQLPARLQIQRALEISIHGRPDVQAFVERLNAAKIGVKANISPSTGRMSGFSFSFDGVAFGASKIDKKYGWASLKQELDYDENEAGNIEFLSSLDGTPGRASRDLTESIAIVEGLDFAVAGISPAAHDTGAAVHDVAPAVDRTVPGVEQTAPEGLAAPAKGVSRAPGRPAPVPARVVDGGRAEPADADLSINKTLTATPTPTTTEGDSQNGYSGYDYNHYQPYHCSPANLASAPTLAGLPNLSPLRVVNNKNGGEKLLQNNAPDHLANRNAGADRIMLGQSGTSTRAEKIARPAAAKIPPGFVSQRPLDLSQRDWTASIPNRISAVRSTGQRVLLAGLIDSRDRVAAIKTNLGYSIPDLKIITDDQLTALLIDAGTIAQPIKITGTPDFCQRASTLAKANNLVVVHDHQITEAERKAAQIRYEQRQREEQKQRLEAPAPRPS